MKTIKFSQGVFYSKGENLRCKMYSQTSHNGIIGIIIPGMLVEYMFHNRVLLACKMGSYPLAVSIQSIQTNGTCVLATVFDKVLS